VTARILYVNHTAQVSGGERSLLELLAALDGRAEPIVAAPAGDLADAVRALGVPLREIPGTAGSLKLHPVHTPQTLAELARAGRAVRGIAKRERIDVVHANSIRAGLIASGVARTGGPPALVHVRDVLPDGTVTRLTRRAIAVGASAVVGNSEYTLSHFRPVHGPVRLAVAHSPIDLDRLGAAAALDRTAARRRLDLAAEAPVLGVVAQLTPWKGQDDAVRILAALRSHPDAQLLLVGSAKFVARATRHDNPAFVRGLNQLARDLGVADRIHLLGERDDVPEVLRAIDLLLMPSWEEPFGRAVVEALAVGVPVAATSAGGPAEILHDGVEGLLLPPRCPDAWADAIEPLLADPERLAAMRRAGLERARAFGRDAHAERMVALYEVMLSSPTR
jgi:glycosyltransferase involved in cell wall biosynthesis